MTTALQPDIQITSVLHKRLSASFGYAQRYRYHACSRHYILHAPCRTHHLADTPRDVLHLPVAHRGIQWQRYDPRIQYPRARALARCQRQLREERMLLDRNEVHARPDPTLAQLPDE